METEGQEKWVIWQSRDSICVVHIRGPPSRPLMALHFSWSLAEVLVHTAIQDRPHWSPPALPSPAPPSLPGGAVPEHLVQSAPQGRWAHRGFFLPNCSPSGITVSLHCFLIIVWFPQGCKDLQDLEVGSACVSPEGRHSGCGSAYNSAQLPESLSL